MRTLLLLCLLLPLGASAQAYPRKPITMIIPNAPAGAFDAAARPLVQALGQQLGQPVVLDNRPAGQGIIGVQAAARSAPDGYTLLFTGSSNISFLPILRPNRLPYDAQKDLAPIVRLGLLDSFVIVHSSVPANSIRELFEMARAKPGAVTWGSWGTTSNSHIYIEWLKKARNIDFYEVPYKTAPQALQAVIAGEVQVMVFGQGQVVPLVKAGKLKALAATGTQRYPGLPQVPPMKETGTGFDLETPLWIGLFAPTGTPPEIIARINGVANNLLRDKSYTEKYLAAFGYLPDEPNSPEQFAETIRRDRQLYADLIKVTGLKDEN